MKRWLADKLMPWCAGNASVWPSTHATQAVLVEQIGELEARVRGSVSGLREALAALDRPYSEGKRIEIARHTLQRALDHWEHE